MEWKRALFRLKRDYDYITKFVNEGRYKNKAEFLHKAISNPLEDESLYLDDLSKIKKVFNINRLD